MWWLVCFGALNIALAMAVDNAKGGRHPRDYYDGMAAGLGAPGVVMLIVGIVTLGAADFWSWLWRAAP